MTEVTIGSLFSGAGALCELAVAPLLGGRVLWHCEFEPPTEKNPRPRQAAARVLEYRFPVTPNLGDITAVDWSRVEPVRVLAGGFPCTDVSTAGQQAGLRPDTRSGLWSQMAYAISVLRPELVVIENVRGLASAAAHCEMEPCSWCLGDGPDQPALRALGAVLGDLADLGYDAVWCGLRASDVGACHGRFRFVILAAPADTVGSGRGVPWLPGSGPGRSEWSAVGRDDPELVLLPIPTAVDARGARNATSGRKVGSAHHSGTTLTDAVWLLPTPKASDGYMNIPSCSDRPRERSTYLGTQVSMLPVNGSTVDWGVYELAIRRHERWLGRPAPFPTITGARGGKTLNPQLSEWMMAWPAGWVTEVPGITPNDAKQVCGNGVVSQQMVAGIRYLLPLLFAEGRWAA